MNKARTKDEILRKAVSEIYAENPSISYEKLIKAMRNKSSYFIVKNKLTKGAVANMLGNLRKGIDITAKNYINMPVKTDTSTILSKLTANTIENEVIKEEVDTVNGKRKSILNHAQGKIVYQCLISIVKNDPTVSSRRAASLLKKVPQIEGFKDMITIGSTSAYLVKVHKELTPPVTVSHIEPVKETVAPVNTYTSEQIVDSIVWMGVELKRLQEIQKGHDAKIEEFEGIQKELLSRIEVLKGECEKLRSDAAKANIRSVELQNNFGKLER
jgi:hypothetical protein